jgi:uncharacterized protein
METTMTEDAAVDLVRAVYRAVEDGDHEALLGHLAADLHWRQAATAVPAAGQDITRATDVLRRVIVPFEQDWDGFTEEVDELFAADGRVVTTGRYRGTFRATGRELEAEFCHLWRAEDDRIVRFRQLTDTAAFLLATER